VVVPGFVLRRVAAPLPNQSQFFAIAFHCACALLHIQAGWLGDALAPDHPQLTDSSSKNDKAREVHNLPNQCPRSMFDGMRSWRIARIVRAWLQSVLLLKQAVICL